MEHETYMVPLMIAWTEALGLGGNARHGHGPFYGHCSYCRFCHCCSEEGSQLPEVGVEVELEVVAAEGSRPAAEMVESSFTE